jgi:hypothetical protein
VIWPDGTTTPPKDRYTAEIIYISDGVRIAFIVIAAVAFICMWNRRERRKREKEEEKRREGEGREGKGRGRRGKGKGREGKGSEGRREVDPSVF